MTASEQPAAELASGIATSVQNGPDGTPWGVLHIQTPLLQASWFLPTEAIGTLVEQLPFFLAELMEKVNEARAKSTNGIVLSGSMNDAKMAAAVNNRLKGNIT